MMEKETVEDQNLKQGLVKVLKGLKFISSKAAAFHPAFGAVGSLIGVAINCLDDEDMQTLKSEFDSVNKGLDQLSQKTQDTLEQIKKEALDCQYASVEENLKHQYREFVKLVNGQCKSAAFIESYSHALKDQNLNTLYSGVVGSSRVFSRPILEVYLEHSHENHQIMEQLCTRLTYLFCIGLIAFMGYCAIIGDDVENRRQEWAEKMEDVAKKMEEALNKCK